MAADGGAMKNGGGLSGRNGGTRQMLKKGPWTTAEDAILMEYVKKHGEGNWNAVQRNSGLMRCGKSCRLRWANHLRPNLRKGAFSPEEERLIVELHSKLGNKWARMASQMPGRTDNEIKNYWNTRLKRRQRAGLPIYPQEVQPQNLYHPNHHMFIQHTRSSRSSSPLSALLSAPPHQPPAPAPYNPPLSIYDHMFDNTPATAIQTHNSQRFTFLTNPPAAGGGLALTLASSSRHFGHGGPQLPFPFNSLHPTFGGPRGMNAQELPSIQTPVPTSTPTTSSGITGSLYEADLSDLPRSNSGLLEDLLHESQALARVNRDSSNQKGYEAMMGNPTPDVHEYQEFVFTFGSSEGEGAAPVPAKETANNNSVMDEDIMSLLENFPVGADVPDWYEEEGGKGDLENMMDGGGDANTGGGNHVEDSKSSSTTTSEATLCWNDMPCIS